MTEQTILLILLFCALAATLGLYILKAAKQTAYRGDERWQTVQLKAGVLADATNWLLIFLLLGAAIFADGEATFTLTSAVRRKSPAPWGGCGVCCIIGSESGRWYAG